MTLDNGLKCVNSLFSTKHLIYRSRRQEDNSIINIIYSYLLPGRLHGRKKPGKKIQIGNITGTGDTETLFLEVCSWYELRWVSWVDCGPNGLQNDLFLLEVIFLFDPVHHKCCMVAKGTDKTEVLHPGTGDAPRTGALMEQPSVGADPGIPMCLNLERHMGHRNLEAQVGGSHCMWEHPHLQRSTGRQA